MTSDNTVAAATNPGSFESNLKARHFLRRLTTATGGGMFIDGFIFASVAAALAGKAMSDDLGISGIWVSLISSSTLIGTFFGGLFLGCVSPTNSVAARCSPST